MPGFSRPVVIGGFRYVDGGCHSATNADLVAGQDVDVVVVSSPLSMRGHGRRPARHPARILHSLELAREAARVRWTGVAVIAFEPDAVIARLVGRSSMDHRRARAVVEASRAAASATAAAVARAAGTPA